MVQVNDYHFAPGYSATLFRQLSVKRVQVGEEHSGVPPKGKAAKDRRAAHFKAPNQRCYAGRPAALLAVGTLSRRCETRSRRTIDVVC